jgi:cob(I)alamin adenosyltransferase
MKPRERPSITTRVGDQGMTYMFSGERIPKDSPRTDAYGDLDELVSLLGVARCHARRKDVRAQLLDLQRELFTVGSELATTAGAVRLLRGRIDAKRLEDMEKRRTALEMRIRLPRGFILPGGTPAGAHLDHARAVSRRLERKVVGLQRRRLVRNRHLIVWLNRLSDFLWLLARHEEGRATILK